MKALTKTQIAVLEGRTVFKHQVKDVADGLLPSEEPIKASSNKKLAKEISRSPWKGSKIYTLTLEERKTCWTGCRHYADCYGNNMRNATRYVGNSALEDRVEKNLADLQAKTDRTNAKRKAMAGKLGVEFSPVYMVVRLHVLGDFYSVEYVAKWARWFGMFPSLRVWGYTHWHPGTAIGDAILTLREALGGVDARQGGRFCIRFSDYRGAGPAALAEGEMADQAIAEGKAFICPEQTQSKAKADSPDAIHCGNCGLCWQSAKDVVFLTH